MTSSAPVSPRSSCRFRRWSRKSWSVFRSLHLEVTIGNVTGRIASSLTIKTRHHLVLATGVSDCMPGDEPAPESSRNTPLPNTWGTSPWNITPVLCCAAVTEYVSDYERMAGAPNDASHLMNPPILRREICFPLRFFIVRI